MSDTDNKNQDSLMDVLNSFENEDVLNEKMNSFAKVRREQKKIEQERRRNLPENEYTIYDNPDDLTLPKKQEMPEVPPAVPVHKPAQEKEGDQTMVFSKEQPPVPEGKSGDTIVYSEQQVTRLSRENRRPVEVKEINPIEDEEDEEEQHSRTVAMVLLVLLIISFAALMGFGFYRFLWPSMQKPADDTAFQEIMTWAKEYDTFGDLEKENVIQFQSIYNQLSSEQKAQVNEVLQSITGKTFDQLLAEATSQDKESDNTHSNITEIAEEKAKIRMAIQALENQLADAQYNLDSANASIDQAYSDFLEAQDTYTQAQSDQASAEDAYNSAMEKYTNALSRKEELQKKADDKSITPEEQKELDGIDEQISDFNKAVSEAETARKDAQQALDEATQNYSDSADYYNSIKDSGYYYEVQIADLNSQIEAKRAELTALNGKQDS